jgi:hypothetical protein
MSREIELVLSCAKPRPDWATKERISGLLDGEIDWNRVLSLAFRHRIPLLLYSNLMSTSSDKLSSEIVSKLQNAYHKNAVRNLLLTRELLRLIGIFEDNGILMVPFKGPILAMQAYGDLTLRSFGDLDVMVHKEDVFKARDLLTSQGYGPVQNCTTHQGLVLLTRECEYALFCRDTLTLIELHWKFLEGFLSVPFDDGLWSRLCTVELEGRKIKSFSPEYLVLYLCAHGAKHRWSELRMMSDLAGIIKGQEIDWDFARHKAAQMGLKRILHTALLLCNGLLETEIPPKIMKDAAGDSRARKMVLEISKRLFDENQLQQKRLDNFLFWPKARERAGDKFRYFMGYMMEPSLRDYNFLPLPEALYPFYLFVRPIRLFWKYRLKRGGRL